ncbi:MAG: hypothetical protein JOZ18_20610 [Chloroflexi bacterium]|nr:hypothetical protein [Chloroflexota bacterium]
MSYVRRCYPVLLVLFCVCLLLLLASYALAMLPPTTSSVTSAQPQLPDLVTNLTPNTTFHHPVPTHVVNMSTDH